MNYQSFVLNIRRKKGRIWKTVENRKITLLTVVVTRGFICPVVETSKAEEVRSIDEKYSDHLRQKRYKRLIKVKK